MPFRAAILLALLGSLALPLAGGEPAKPTRAVMVHYSGKVQGVGFRATAAEIARDHPVGGWVKNLPDGRVQLLAEGPREAVEKFLKAVRERWKGNIEKEQAEDRKPAGTFKGFEVAR